MGPLEKLFGSSARVKLMRLFLFNPDEVFAPTEVRAKIGISSNIIQRELSRLASAKLIVKGSEWKEVSRKVRGRPVKQKKRIRGWRLNKEFPYIDTLTPLLLSNKPSQKKKIAQYFRGIGSVKLLVLSGFFAQNNQSLVDVLIVGDRLKKRVILQALRSLELELGKDLRYTAIKTTDFYYRRNVHDKFLRDVFDYPHEVLVDKIEA